VVTRGQIPWKAVRKMLDVCEDGWRYEDKVHKRWLYYRGRRAFLPLGKHGHRRNPEIEVGHIRGLVRQLGIDDCAKQELELLR
jgi:hypothetical protein